jgi:MFS family permease
MRLYRWRDPAILAAGWFALASGFAQFGATAALGDVARTFGAPAGGASITAKVGLSGTTLGVGLAIIRLASLGSLPLAGLADRRGRKVTLLSCVALGLALTATAAISPTFWWFVFIFALGRPLLTATNTIAGVIAAEETASRERAKAIALVTAGFGVGAGLIAILRGVFGATLGFRGLFVLSLIPLAITPLVARVLKEPDRYRRLKVGALDVSVHLPGTSGGFRGGSGGAGGTGGGTGGSSERGSAGAGGTDRAGGGSGTGSEGGTGAGTGGSGAEAGGRPGITHDGDGAQGDPNGAEARGDGPDGWSDTEGRRSEAEARLPGGTEPEGRRESGRRAEAGGRGWTGRERRGGTARGAEPGGTRWNPVHVRIGHGEAGRFIEEARTATRQAERSIAVGSRRLWLIGRLRPDLQRRLWRLTALTFTFSFVTGPANTFLFVYAENVLGMSRGTTALMVAAAGPIGLVGLLIGRWGADTFGRRFAAAVSQVVVALAGIVTYSGAPSQVVIGYLLAIVASSAYGPAIATLVAELFPTSVRATIAGWLVAAGVLGAVAGLIVFGTISDVLNSFGLAAVVICGPAVLASLLFAQLPETRGMELEQSAPESVPG